MPVEFVSGSIESFQWEPCAVPESERVKDGETVALAMRYLHAQAPSHRWRSDHPMFPGKAHAWCNDCEV